MDPVSKSRISSGFSEKSLANLKKFQPGVSGNPSGRPRKSLFAKELEKIANDKVYVPQLVQAVKERMLQPRVAGVLETREFLDRVEGKVVDTVDMNLSGTVQLASVIEQRRKKRAGSKE